MDFSVYGQPRTFRMPHLKTTVTVGPDSIWLALFTGPVHFVRRGALIEAVVVGFATCPIWPVDMGVVFDTVAGIVYLGAAFLAPVLIAGSYERRGWVDVTERSALVDPDDDEALDAWSREREEARLQRAQQPQGYAWEKEESDLE